MEALSGLVPGEYEDHTIWTTLEPCFMCSGAIVHSHVGVVRFAAGDHFVEGVERLPELNRWVRDRWPTRHGPEPGPVGDLCSILHVAWHLRRSPDGRVSTRYRRGSPDLVERAGHALDAWTEPPGDHIEAARRIGLDIRA